ncbi:hypothetical protein AXW83_05280 [Bosea sp. PAMC 26642]|nr:hypothetical protein AXW83_05280 [Bosea sp. PAMC 26642]
MFGERVVLIDPPTLLVIPLGDRGREEVEGVADRRTFSPGRFQPPGQSLKFRLGPARRGQNLAPDPRRHNLRIVTADARCSECLQVQDLGLPEWDQPRARFLTLPGRSPAASGHDGTGIECLAPVFDPRACISGCQGSSSISALDGKIDPKHETQSVALASERAQQWLCCLPVDAAKIPG